MLDPKYVLARRSLLNTLDLLVDQKDALVLVGAQAVYLWTGPSTIAVAEYTTDADLALDPLLLSDGPELAATLEASGYVYRQNPGLWLSPEGVGIDLLVPEAVAGQGTRSADVRPHDK